MARQLRVLTTGVFCAAVTASAGGVLAGSEEPNIGEVAGLFDRICFKTAPDFTEFANARSLDAVTRESDSEAGLFYHLALNVSFKSFLDQDAPVCSMVFSSSASNEVLRDAIRERATRRLGANGFTQTDWEDVDEFTTFAGERMLLWGPYNATEDLKRVVVLRKPDG